MKRFMLMILMILIITNLQCSKKSAVNSVSDTKVPVMVEPVRTGKIREVLHFTGDIKGIEEIDVYPKVQGKLIENKVKEGDHVDKGTVLALVDRDISGMKYEPFEVLSPISGIVAMVFLDKGAVVVPPTMSTTMGTPVARVVNMNKAKVIVNVGDKEYPKIKIGQIAEIVTDAYPSRVFTGTVSAIAPVINPYTRTAPVEIIIPNKELLLRSGMFVEVKLIIEEREGIVIKADYILGSEGSHFVYIDDNGIARRREIKTGIVEENNVEVLEGLREGESIVTVGAEMLADGSKLDIKRGEEK